MTTGPEASGGAFEPKGFRRAVHAAAACLVVYYLLPAEAAWSAFLRTWGIGILLGAATALEILRLSGRLRTESFFGLREYERRRVSGYLYAAYSFAALLLFFPQTLAVPCIVGAAIGDPIIGELRAAGKASAAWGAGIVFVGGVFLVSGWTPVWAAIAGALATSAEHWKFRHVDDDLLMPLVPAFALAAASWAGGSIGVGPALPEPFLSPWGGSQ